MEDRQKTVDVEQFYGKNKKSVVRQSKRSTAVTGKKFEEFDMSYGVDNVKDIQIVPIAAHRSRHERLRNSRRLKMYVTTTGRGQNYTAEKLLMTTSSRRQRYRRRT